MRHVIVEGPDGAGKSMLVDQLASLMPLPVHTRASHSRTGPVPNLSEWVNRDLRDMTSAVPCIYDRHPIISEVIYAPIVRQGLSDRFADPVWVRRVQAAVMQKSIVVWCMPPFPVCKRNVSKTRDMEGVADNITALYHAYYGMSLVWPGPSFRYDYTRHNAHGLSIKLKEHIEGTMIHGYRR